MAHLAGRVLVFRAPSLHTHGDLTQESQRQMILESDDKNGYLEDVVEPYFQSDRRRYVRVSQDHTLDLSILIACYRSGGPSLPHLVESLPYFFVDIPAQCMHKGWLFQQEKQ